MPPTRSSSAAAAAAASDSGSPSSSVIPATTSPPAAPTAAAASAAAPPLAKFNTTDDPPSATAAAARRKSTSSRRQVVFSPHPPSLHPYAPSSSARQTRLAALQQQAGAEGGRSLGSPTAPQAAGQAAAAQGTYGWPAMLFDPNSPRVGPSTSTVPGTGTPPSAGQQPQRGILKRTGSAEIRRAKDVQEGTRVNGRLRSASLLSVVADEDGSGGGNGMAGPSSTPLTTVGARARTTSQTNGTRTSSNATAGPSRSASFEAALAESSCTAAARAAAALAIAGDDGMNDEAQSIVTHLRTILACGAANPNGVGPFVPVSLPDVVESYSALISRFRSLPTAAAAAMAVTSSNGSTTRSPKGTTSTAKAKLPATSSPNRPPPALVLEGAVDSLRPRASALADALVRDLGRFFGGSSSTSPTPSVSDNVNGGEGGRSRGSRESSPADDDVEHLTGGGRLRKGFTELEVTRRREEVQAGHGAIRLAGALLANDALWSCFTDDDLRRILGLLLRLPLPADGSPTPSAAPTASKRTVTFALHALSQLSLPSRVLGPLADDLLGAFLKPLANPTTSTTIKKPPAAAAANATSASGVDTPLKVKLECLGALGSLVRTNPDVLLPLHRTLVPQLLRLLLDPKPAIQIRASAALGSVLLGGRSWLDRARPGDDLARARKIVEEEVALSVVKALSKKSAPVTPGSSVREDKLVLQLLSAFRASYTATSGISNPPAPWALATWAVVITLLGRNIQTNVSDLLEFMNVVRGTASSGLSGAKAPANGGGIAGMAPLIQKGWDHVLHGIISQSSRRGSSAATDPGQELAPTLTAESDPVLFDLPWILAPKRTFLVFTNLNSAFARDVPPGLLDAPAVPAGGGGKVWASRVDAEVGTANAALARARQEAMLAATAGLINAVYALSGAILGERATAVNAGLAAPMASPPPTPAARPSKAPPDSMGTPYQAGQGRILVPATPADDEDSRNLSMGVNDDDTEMIDAGVSIVSVDETQLGHLSTLMDSLIQPLLLSHLLPIIAIDSIKIAGWRILVRVFGAPLEEPTRGKTSQWRLDRLLCPGFLNGSIAAVDFPTGATDRQRVLSTLCASASAAGITPTEIPPWPRAWVARHLGQALDLVRAAVIGVRGLKDEDEVGAEGWVTSAEGVRILPTIISAAYRSVLAALNSLQPTAGVKPSHEYQTGLASVAAFIGTLFKLDVMAYRPPSMEFEANLNLVRYGLMDHLVGLALDILGEDAFGCVLLPTKDMVLGAGKSGAPTLAGILITTLIGTTLPPLGGEPMIRKAFVATLQRLVDAGLQGPLAFNLLGDLTSNLDKLAPGDDEEEEAVRFALWKMMAEKWIELYPSTAAASLNLNVSDRSASANIAAGVPSSDADMDSAHSMTLRLLTDLLTDPFRRFPVLWTSASPTNVATWGSLLETTISRAVAKGMNPNIVVVEDLAAGLTDVDMVDIPCQATFDCLRFIALAVEYPGDHEPTNDSQLAARRFMKYFPEGFLELLALALDKAYPTVLHHPEMLGSAVGLLKSTGAFLMGLPLGYVAAAVSALTPALSVWVKDEHQVLQGDVHIEAVFDVYELVLRKLAVKATTPEGSQYFVMPPTNDSLHRFGGLFVASMQAPNERFVLAFRDMWAATFNGAPGLSYPADVEALLKGLRELNMGVEAIGLGCSLLPLPQIEETQPQAELPSFPDEPQSSLYEASGRSAAESAYDADTSSASPLEPDEELTQPSVLPTIAIEEPADPQPAGIEVAANIGETLVLAADEEGDIAPAAPLSDTERDKHQSTPSKKRRRQPSAPRSIPRSSKRRRGNSEESVIPATPSQPFEDTADEADIQDLIEMEPPIPDPAPVAKAAAAIPTPARKKANTPRRSLTKSASSGGLVSAVSSWIPRFFGSPALQQDEEEAVDGELDVSIHSSPEKDSMTWRRLQKERLERTLVTRSKAHGGTTIWQPIDGPNDLFTPRVPVQNVSIDLTMVSGDDEDDGDVVPESDDKANRSTEPYDTPGTPKSARRSHRQVERRRLHDSLPRPDTSVSLTAPGNGRAPLISAEMVDTDSDEGEGEPKTSSVAGQDAEPAQSQIVSQPTVLQSPALEPVSDDVSAYASPLANRTRTLSNSGSGAQVPTVVSQASKGINGHAVAPSTAPAEPSELLALLHATGPHLSQIGSASNVDLVQIQRLLEGTLAAVSKEMQVRLLR